MFIRTFIDFNNSSIEEVSKFKSPIEHVRKTVRPARLNNRDKQRREKWWMHGRSNSSMRKSFEGLKCYFAISQVSKYTNFRSVDINILPCEAIMVVASDDFFILGVLNSKIHLDWVRAQSSTLKGDTRYTNTTCFETFPFPVKPAENDKNEVRKIMAQLEEFRINEVRARNCTLTDLYNDFFDEPTSQLFRFHTKLDKAVAESYDWKYVDEDDYKERLFKLNQKLTS